MGTMMTATSKGSWGSANVWINAIWLAPMFIANTAKSTSVIVHGFSIGFMPSPVLAIEASCLIRAVRRLNGANPSTVSAKPIVRTASATVDTGGVAGVTISGTLDSEQMFQVVVPYPLTHFYVPELRPVIEYGNGTTTLESWSLEYYPTVDMSVGATVWFEVN